MTIAHPSPAIAALLAEHPDVRFGFVAAALDGSLAFGVRAGEVFTQASVIKVPVLWELHRAAGAGELSLDETLPVDPAAGAGGCGVLQSFASGVSSIGLGDLGVLMIVLSDNTATNLLIDRVGIDAVNALLQSKGVAQTRLRRRMMDAQARAAGRENTATPAEAVAVMRRLHEEADSGDRAASATLGVLRLKKESPVTAALGDLDPPVRPATKPGMLEGLRTEWALVRDARRPYSMALMADGANDKTLEPLFRRLAAAIHAEFSAA
ncbi:MAG: serine hydrolase [Planctomycetota bacterium]